MIIQFLKRHSLKQIAILVLEEYFGFLFRYLPSYEGMMLRRLLYKFTFNKIGKKCLIYQNVVITHGYKINAGDYLAINCGSHLDGRGGLEIGDYVLIGPNVFIGSSNHVINSTVDNPRIFLGHVPKETVIGANVWIGANCVVCPGVKIGDNSIISAGSVVIEDIPDSVIAAGNPAKVIQAL